MTREEQDKLRRALYNAKFTTDAEDENPFVGVYFDDLLAIIEEYVERPIYHEGLFAKMQEAGYLWDAEKKELRKIQPHYDIANFQPFDKVLTRDTENGSWNVNLFSYYIDDKDARVIARFRCINSLWHQCIPFNNDTKHLLGTTDMPSEEYINW